jgi:hypothetical protein
LTNTDAAARRGRSGELRRPPGDLKFLQSGGDSDAGQSFPQERPGRARREPEAGQAALAPRRLTPLELLAEVETLDFETPSEAAEIVRKMRDERYAKLRSRTRPRCLRSSSRSRSAEMARQLKAELVTLAKGSHLARRRPRRDGRRSNSARAAPPPWTLPPPRGYRGAAMRYRIEMSPARRGFARIDFAGRIIALEATQNVGPVWLVGVSDPAGEREGSVTVRADNAGDAVWRVAQATVRAVSQLTDSPLEGEVTPGSDSHPINSP